MTTINIGANTGNTLSGWIDSPISSASPSSNYVSLTVLNILNGANVWRNLLRIPDVATDIGSTSTINSVTLYLCRINAGGTGGVSLYRLKKTPTFNQATWQNQSTGTPWDTAGALGVNDYDSTVLATGTCPSGGATTFTMSGAGLTALVQGWVDGSIVNNGFIIAADTGFTTQSDVRSANSAIDGQRPYFVIDYTPSIPPSITVSDPTVSHLSGTATFTITASGTFGSDITVDYATADVTATAGVDYVAKTGTATILPGQTTVNVVVDILP